MLWTLFFVVKSKKGGKATDKIFKYSEHGGEIIITGLKKGVSDTSIVIPETIDGMPVVEIGPTASEFTSIVDIKIGGNVRKIGDDAFYNCDELSSVTWNCKCDVIPAYCFSECPKLTNFDFSNIKKIGRYAFWRSGLQEVCLPKSIEILEEGTFSECSELQSVTWNCTCDVISACCFSKSSNLTQFDLSGIKKVEKHAFLRSGLISVTISKGTAVGKRCFAFCESLTKVEWLSGRNIEGDIFAECKNIKEICISDKVKNIEASAFVSSPDAEITFI